MRFKLGRRAISFDSKLFLRVVVKDFFIRRVPHKLKTHARWRAEGVERWPFRLIDDCNVFHLKRCGPSVRAKGKPRFGHRDYPIQPGRRDGRVKIVNLIFRNNLPLK